MIAILQKPFERAAHLDFEADLKAFNGKGEHLADPSAQTRAPKQCYSIAKPAKTVGLDMV